MNLFKSLLAWIAKPLRTKEKTMSDQYDNNGQVFQPVAAPELTVNDLTASLAAEPASPAPAAPAPVAETIAGALAPVGDVLAGIAAKTAETALVAALPAPVAPLVAAVVNTDVLKAVLLALGHDLGPVWDDAIALAKRAL